MTYGKEENEDISPHSVTIIAAGIQLLDVVDEKVNKTVPMAIWSKAGWRSETCPYRQRSQFRLMMMPFVRRQRVTGTAFTSPLAVDLYLAENLPPFVDNGIGSRHSFDA